jgi:excisionase family DNA binding protein
MMDVEARLARGVASGLQTIARELVTWADAAEARTRSAPRVDVGSQQPSGSTGEASTPGEECTDPDAPRLVTVAEAARLLGVGRTTLYHLMAVGDIRSVRIGRSHRIAVAELERYIAAHTAEPARLQHDSTASSPVE